MANIKAVVKSLRVVEFEGESKVIITFTKNVPAIVTNDDGEYEVGEADHFSLPTKVFVAQAINANDEIAFLKSCVGLLGQRELGGAFFDATIEFDSDLVKEGDEFTKYDGSKDTAENDFFNRNITKIQMSKRGLNHIDKLIYG